MAEHEWFRASSWDAGTAEEFETRLQRARKPSRAQYVRIQASHLLESPDAPTRETGRVLLRRVIADYPDDDSQTNCAWEQLGDSLAREGRLDEADRALRETLRRIALSPIGRSGTSGTTELRLAEVLLARGDPASIDDAARQLELVEPQVRTQATFFRDVLYRYLLACARAAHAQQAPEASELARAALDVADEDSPRLPRHPTVGLPQASTAERAELRSIAAV